MADVDGIDDADMSFKGVQAGACGKIPEAHGAITAAREGEFAIVADTGGGDGFAVPF